MARHKKAFAERSMVYRSTWVLTGALAVGVVMGVSTAAVIAGTLTSRGEAQGATSMSKVGDAGRLLDPLEAAVSAPTAGIVASHVAIPDIGVSTDLESLGVDGTGVLHPPVDPDKAGWYAAGILPGQVGAAVIAGHVDSVTRPAVFQHLGDLKPGAKILVTMSDGTTLTFETQSTDLVQKANFPTSSVYGNVPTPQLRVITCDGPFDRTTGHYADNFVVFATLVAS